MLKVILEIWSMDIIAYGEATIFMLKATVNNYKSYGKLLISMLGVTDNINLYVSWCSTS